MIVGGQRCLVGSRKFGGREEVSVMPFRRRRRMVRRRRGRRRRSFGRRRGVGRMRIGFRM